MRWQQRKWTSVIGIAGLLAALLPAARAADTEPAPAAQPLITAQTRLAVVGDSITEQKTYSRYIELYLLATAPETPEAVMQFGWSGDRAPGFANRMEFDCLSFFNPTLMTTCFGMNDGNYRAYEDRIGEEYRKGMEAIVAKMRAHGGALLVGGPGTVDTVSFRRPNVTPAEYNENLAQLSEIARRIAVANNQPFADIHAATRDAMVRVKADNADTPVMGGDGVHPGNNGQLAMAYAFLKGMGFDGAVGEIVIDLNANEARATGTHRVLGVDERGAVEIESARWPFQFTTEGGAQSTLSMLPYLPFNEDLNRFTLRVAGLQAAEYDVTWGEARRTVSRERLQTGINLSAEFAGETPFRDAWAQLERKVRAKQDLETFLVKQERANMRSLERFLGKDAAAEIRPTHDALWNRLWANYEKHGQAVREAVTPVKHTIRVVPATK